MEGDELKHRVHDLTGERFGRLKGIEPRSTASGKAAWLCQCSCGESTIVQTGDLRSGRTRSCGCLRREVTSRTHTVHGHRGVGRKPRLYGIWKGMRERCQYPKNVSYKRYGGRGITVCAEWDDYEAFHDWAMSNGYRSNLTIDRIDNDGPYSPENCQWLTRAQNVRKGNASRAQEAQA